MRYGTCHFVSHDWACGYYSGYVGDGWTANRMIEKLVKEKLKNKEIAIGSPVVKEGETLSIEEGRYFINQKAPIESCQKSN